MKPLTIDELKKPLGNITLDGYGDGDEVINLRRSTINNGPVQPVLNAAHAAKAVRQAGEQANAIKKLNSFNRKFFRELQQEYES